MSSPSDIAIMLGDDALVRLCVVWPKLSNAQRNDEDEIADIANILPHKVQSVIKRAKTNGLIFEDGSVNEYALKYINMIVADTLNGLKKQRQPKTD